MVDRYNAVISIPYGAIKRQKREFIIKDNAHISIPYGAIKSLKVAKNIKQVLKFQFLMVRLKVGKFDI